MGKGHYINGQWIEGSGPLFAAYNPATEEKLWTGREATEEEISKAILSAGLAATSWSALHLSERTAYLEEFARRLEEEKDDFALTISKSCGKPLWEAATELEAMIHKIASSIEAYQQRCPEKIIPMSHATLHLSHRPHGIAAIFGPFNFPGHLPHGHIVPALLAGNTVVFKGSEWTPLVSEHMAELWQILPKGVFNLIQGGATSGRLLACHGGVNALFFTGSYATGISLLKWADPRKLVALEMGGNNPIVVSSILDPEAAASLTLHSSFISAGQRCACARRLILSPSDQSELFLSKLIEMSAKVAIGPYTDHPEPFMGPLINAASKKSMVEAQEELIRKGGEPLLLMKEIRGKGHFLTCGIIDVTEIKERDDVEHFGPLLQLIRTSSFEEALREANHTDYGLAAAIFTDKKEEFDAFYRHVKAGILNWNAPTVGASGRAPFGGIGKSGNYRPSGFYAADYCAYPVVSMENAQVAPPREYAKRS